MTDIVDVISIKLTTSKSHVERRVLTRARDEITGLREKVNKLESLIIDSNINLKQMSLFDNPYQNLDLFENVSQ